jgi:hypothetical protein
MTPDTPLTPEELAARDKVPTWGTEVFERVIDANGVLGDTLLTPSPVREHGPPPYPGAVFDDASHRWKVAGKGAGDKGQGTSQTKTLTDAERAAVGQHVLPGLDAKIQAADAGAAAKPGVMAWAHEKAVNAMARVGVFLIDHHAMLGGLLGGVLDTPDDLKNKFGYNPSISSGHGSAIQDPVREQLGISTHLAATIATHVLSAGIAFARKKLAGKTSESAPAGLAELLAELFGILADEFGLEKPDAAAIAAAIGGM